MIKDIQFRSLVYWSFFDFFHVGTHAKECSNACLDLWEECKT